MSLGVTILIGCIGIFMLYIVIETAVKRALNISENLDKTNALLTEILEELRNK